MEYSKKTLSFSIAGVVGILIVIGIVVIVGNDEPKTVPDPTIAKPAEVAYYLASEKFQAKPLAEKHDYLMKFLFTNNSPSKRKEVLASLDNLPDDKVKRIRNNIVDAIKYDFIQQAKQYKQLGRTDKMRYIQRQMDRFETLQQWANAARTSEKVKKNTPEWTQKGAFELFMSRTNPIEQAALETYLSDVFKVYLKREAERRFSRYR